MYKYLIILSFVCLCSSCIDPLDIAIENEEPTLVVLAEVSDLYETYTVDLSRTTDYETLVDSKEIGATVSVIDGQGREYMFREVQNGIYTSCPDEFVGQVGEYYRLRIVTIDDTVYESDPEPIFPTGEIDSVHFKRYDRYYTANGLPKKQRGLKVYCDFKDNPTEDYFMVDWQGTFQFSASPMDRENRFCWNTEKSKFDINLHEDRYTNNSLIKDFEVTFLADGFRFTEKYNLQIRLKSLTHGAYRFWSLVQKQFENDGSIFSALPAQINSNIKCVSNPDKKVLGYFVTTSIQTKRVWVPRYLLPGINNAALACMQMRPNDPLPEYCYDCTKFQGSENTPPDYWAE